MTIPASRHEVESGPRAVTGTEERGLFGLSRIIDPLEKESFRDKYWEKQVLLVQREDPGCFSDLLTLDDVDLLLFSAGVNLDGIRVLTEGKEMPVSELEHLSGQNGRVTVLETLYQLYRTGSTIALNALEQRWEPLSRLSAELSAETSTRVQTNVYLTPGGGAQGLSPHYDTHDVCILQVHGVKRWTLYGTAHELPLRDQPFDHSKVFEREVEQEIDLKPGDVLYLPRGTVHAATSTDSASVHITVGFRPLLWNAVIQEAVNAVLGDDVRFRTGLPMGFANDAQAQKETEETLTDLLASLTSRLSPASMTAGAVKRAVSLATPRLRHHLTDLEGVASIGLDTPVRLQPGIRWGIEAKPERIELRFHNKTVAFPLHVSDEVRYVATGGEPSFTPRSVPGLLDEPGRLVLVQALVREGFLTLS